MAILPFLFFSLFYFLKVPIGQTPDEPAHLNYVQYIADTGKLPSYDNSGVSHHPPLYYFLMAPFFLLFRNVYVLRIFSVLFSLLNIFVIQKLIKEMVGEGKLAKDLSWGTAIFCSLVPMYNFMGIAVSNDSLTSLLGSLLILFSILALKQKFSQKVFFFWALAFFSSIFTKIVLWPIVFLSGVIVLLTQKNRRASTMIVFVISVVALSFWFYRNVSLYGKWDILGWKELKKVEYFLVEGRMIQKDPRGWLIILFHSFWGIFSWFSIYLPLMVYSILRKVTVLFFPVFLLFLYRHFKNNSLSERTIVIFISFFVLTFLAIVKDNFNFFHPQGRYLFSVISVVGFYYTASIYQISEYFSQKIFKPYKRIVFFLLLFIPLAALNFLSMVTVGNYFSE